MAKTNIVFNNKNYSIDDASLSTASAALASHLSTVMNGSGAVINLCGISYSIDSAKLSAATNAFVSHLGTVAGNGYKVVVGGGEGYAFEPISVVLDGNYDDMTTAKLSNGQTYIRLYDKYVSKEAVESLTLGMSGQYETINGDRFVNLSSGHGWNSNSGLVAYDGLDPDSLSEGIWVMDFYASYNTPVSVDVAPAITASAPVEYSIDATKVAGAVTELETVLGGLHFDGGAILGCDTLTWDGNTEGLVCVADILYKVSDATPIATDFSDGFVITLLDGTVYEATPPAVEVVSGIVLPSPSYFISVTDEGVGVDMEGASFPEAGLYFVNYTDTPRIVSLTIPNYTGFPHSEGCGH